MNKLFLQALRVLPEEYIDDKTTTAVFGENTVVAANPRLQPITYNRNTEKWELLTAEGGGPIPKLTVRRFHYAQDGNNKL